MSEYASLFTPFWKVFDVVLALVGVWIVLQPSALVESYAALVFSRERGDKLGLPSAVTTELLALSTARENVHYETRLLRSIGASFVVAGVIGLLTVVSQVVLVSALTAVTVGSLTIVLVNGKRATPRRAASLSLAPDHVVAWWLVAVFVVEAAAEAAVGTRTAVAAASATLICAVALSLLRLLPTVLSGVHVALERQIDRRFRAARFGVVALFAEWPSLAWAAGLDDNRPWSVVARIVVSVGLICVVAFMATSSRRLDRDLRRTVADSLT